MKMRSGCRSSFSTEMIRTQSGGVTAGRGTVSNSRSRSSSRTRKLTVTVSPTVARAVDGVTSQCWP